MNRVIKFRGKRKDTGEWITGGYVEWTDIRGNKQYQIVSSVGYHNDVLSETVCQFTGLDDKEGREIYEDDIISDGRVFRVLWDNRMSGFVGEMNCKDDERIGLAFLITHKVCKIIGNIHDNPELLQI